MELCPPDLAYGTESETWKEYEYWRYMNAHKPPS